jgi:hypothetical protein
MIIKCIKGKEKMDKIFKKKIIKNEKFKSM